MKILWFSNAVLSDSDVKGTGSWLYTMGSALVEKGIQLYNITQSAAVDTLHHYRINDNLFEWVIPSKRFNNQTLPSLGIIDQLKDIVFSVSPDIIHVWGMEAYWGLLFTRGYIKTSIVTILEIQGLYSECARVYMGALSFRDQLRCIGIKELVFPSLSIFAQRKRFCKLGKKEEVEQLRYFKNISYQSDWVRSQITSKLNDEATLYKTTIGVRDAFFRNSYNLNCDRRGSPMLLTVYGGNSPYKGKHDIIKALAILKQEYPDIQLKIIGCSESTRPFWRQSGYFRFLKSLVREYGLSKNIEFIGTCNADEMVVHMNSCHLMIHSSYVESYSLCLAESMAFGIPSVISYAGAMPELAIDSISGLFYSPGDYHMCAAQVSRILKSKQLSVILSTNSRRIAFERNLPINAGNRQLEIYKSLFDDAK